MSVYQHYEQHLADHYTWMFGLPFEEMVQEQTKLFESLGLNYPAVAVDLGCGSGFQSLALQAMGAKKVHAFDLSGKLLNELNERVSGDVITTYRADIVAFSDYFVGEAETIVCMGDTLTHLPNNKSVDALLENVAGKLARGGIFILSWRDLSDLPLNEEVMIDVRADSERILKCSLENLGTTVRVTDNLWIQSCGDWKRSTSSYEKLKLPKDLVANSLSKHGFLIKEARRHRGMIVLKAAPLANSKGAVNETK